ncbi:hypothetical protein ALC62_13711 [Cyphomyrmex costatus]|uniref:Uncharacterized protein n=1 Tax=Cyphomyrmex costatus TaxID=456900 RepID=A0A195C5Z2_9HYME|nr:hypothetical protein ALC62_13711 [Cyphomyrmex costatus]
MPRGHNSALYERGLCSYARFATYESLSTNGEERHHVNYSYLERSNASPSQSGKRISRLGTRWRTLARWRTRDKRAHEIWKRSTADLDARSTAMHGLLPVPRSREIAVIRGRVAALCGHDHCWITRHNGEARRDWR